MKSRQLSPNQQSLNKTKTGSLKRNLLIAIGLLLLSIVIRLPFFFRDVIDWDESTFILMGQSILDGHLPYTNLWDNKPPLAFVCYALIIALFGKSIISVRIAGAVCVAFVSFCTYLIGKTLWGNRVGIVSATLFVILASSLISGGQATMTEHLALVPLMGAMTLLVTQRITLPLLFICGILMAVASLIRLNLAYVAVIVGLFVIFATKPRSLARFFQRGLVYAAGGCLVVFLTYLPYAIAGYQQVWFDSVIVAPLSYANSQLSELEILGNYLINKVLEIRILTCVGLMEIGLIFVQSLAAFKQKRLEKKLGLICLFLFFLGTGISILRSGEDHRHYLIQLVPFIALITAAYLSTFLHKPISRLKTSVIVLVLGIL